MGLLDSVIGTDTQALGDVLSGQAPEVGVGGLAQLASKLLSRG